MSLPDVCRKLGIPAATFYTWRKKYGGILPSELKHKVGWCQQRV
jgi:putative transposase